MEQNEIYNKFTVIKNEDIEKYLTAEQKIVLQGIKMSISLGRLNDRKPHDNKYLIVNEDEPYAQTVKDMILKNISNQHDKCKDCGYTEEFAEINIPDEEGFKSTLWIDYKNTRQKIKLVGCPKCGIVRFVKE